MIVRPDAAAFIRWRRIRRARAAYAAIYDWRAIESAANE
jgi:hypothetical protein